MPFKKGNKLAKGNGRKGYEYEQEQLRRMKKIFNKGLFLIEKMLEGKATTNERIRYEDVKGAIMKIMDKFHADKEHISIENPEQTEALKRIADSIEKIAEEKENA